jgi:N6-adenosine-specific RNA methylase IME4
MPLASIRIGKRHRRDMGDIDGLAQSISESGLLHPIVVNENNKLVAGERRLAACKKLGWSDVRVTVVNIQEIARGEYAENVTRKDFTPSELVAITRAIEQRERDLAQQRMTLGKVSTGSTGKTRDKVAVPFGISGRTLEKARAVVDAAEAEPEKFNKLLADMDRTGRVNGVFRRLKVAKQAEQIRAEPPPWPNRGPYRVGAIDLPWPYEKRDEDPSHRAARPYPTMSITQMGALPVPSIMHADSILWSWTTNYHMREAFALLDGWGFEVKTILTWAKDHFGFGDWLRGQTEHCLMAIRGEPIVTLTNQSTLLHAPVRGHSQKPIEFYDLVESLCPAPRYADLFSRYQHNDKWDCHGDESPRVEAAE